MNFSIYRLNAKPYTKVMNIAELALTFDDVLLVPALSKVLPREVDLSVGITSGISLKIPLLSAAMDTVTEANTAIGMAQAGGLGVIHRNMSPGKQALEVAKVKKFESGMITDPVCVQDTATVRDVVQIVREKRISGLPVLDENDRLAGIVTSRDLRFIPINDVSVKRIMTPRDQLVTASPEAETEEIEFLLHKHRIEKNPDS